MAGSISLRSNILRLVVGLLALTTMIILANVWIATNNHAQQQLSRNLQVAEGVLQEILANREAQLINSATVLTADFGFKQVVATGDRGTIDSVLLNHGERIKADLMALVSLDGTTVTSVPAVLQAQQPFTDAKLIDRTLREGGAASFLVLDGKLYQVIMLTVDAPTPVAIALVGFELDQALIEQLKQITQLDISIRVANVQSEQLLISTLPAAQQREIGASLNQDVMGGFGVGLLQPATFISREFQLAQVSDFSIAIVLTEDIGHLLSEFLPLQANISIIAGIAIILAMFFAVLLSRRMADPLTRLAGMARSIASGNYQLAVNTECGSRELNHLVDAFQSMQANIRDREAEITYQAQRDMLTSLFNRHHAGQLLEERLSKQTELLVVGINIFGFRRINDVFGYQNGDICLQVLAARVNQLGGLAARLTGGELLWVPESPVSREQLEDIKSSLERAVDTGEVTIPLKVAIGLIDCPQHATTAEELFRRMNIVLDEAQITRQLILSYDEKLEQRYQRRLSIITELKQALSDRPEELRLFYQPKLSLVSGKVESAEALIRWVNGTLGFVPPDEFISVAEHAGFIDEITDWVISRAVQDIVSFDRAKVEIKVAINLSARDVVNPHLLPSVLAKLEENALSTHKLSFEMTESDLVSEPEKAIEYLQAFREAGFDIALDDFGTGYSSLAYLKNLPIDVLKVDKSFVLALDSQRSDQNIVQSTLKLAHSFGLAVVAEGVENEATLSLLSKWGCEWAQGYYISKPVPVEEFIDWYHQQTVIDE